MFCPPLRQGEIGSSCSLPAICLHSVFTTMLLNTTDKIYCYLLHIPLPYQYLNFFFSHISTCLANNDISSTSAHMNIIIQAKALQN